MNPKINKWFNRNSHWVMVVALLVMYSGLIGAMIWIG